ncbi:MAG: DUF1772 domain-containing protein [Candidatus Polarisedimenticolaceae bacterium]|nr:DUF1772 domain-containing protein [Candidatus Polarisedimenticolaceae bacterium]
MKNRLLAVNHGYYFWGTSIYVGLLWSLHFIFYPSWASITPASVQGHFMVPVNAATDFFTIVVPLMLIAGLVMVYMEWQTKQRWPAILAYASLLLMMMVGYFLIRPINESIMANIETSTLQAAALKSQLESWMFYNDLRALIMTAMWLIILYYFFSKGDLLEKLSD